MARAKGLKPTPSIVCSWRLPLDARSFRRSPIAPSPPTSPPCAVVGLGQCSLDLFGTLPSYPDADRKAELNALLVQGGGPVATALVTLQRLGVATAFLGRIGSDDHGRRIRKGLAAEGVDCRGLKTDRGRSSQFAFVAVEEGSGRRNIFWTRGSARPLAPPQVNRGMICSARVLHLDGLHLEPALVAARLAREAGVVTVLDGGTLRPGSEDLLPYIDHLLVSERFAGQLRPDGSPEAVLADLFAWGAQAVGVTLGERGCWAQQRGEAPFFQTAFPVAAVDTTGCGDVFHGAYIFGLLQQWPLPVRIRFASAAAALSARALGGRTAIPGRREIDCFLQQAGSPRAKRSLEP